MVSFLFPLLLNLIWNRRKIDSLRHLQKENSVVEGQKEWDLGVHWAK